jgi:hypothetical protein
MILLITIYKIKQFNIISCFVYILIIFVVRLFSTFQVVISGILFD